MPDIVALLIGFHFYPLSTEPNNRRFHQISEATLLP